MLTVSEAATYAQRSAATIRRWIRDAKLTKHSGPVREGGGHPPALVDRAELVAFLLASEQTPRARADAPLHTPDSDAVAHLHAGVAHPADLEVERLKGALEAAQLRGALETERARNEALREQLAQAREAGEALLHARDDAQAERDDWKARHDALGAELAALRERRGMAWWRRLLPAPQEPTA